MRMCGFVGKGLPRADGFYLRLSLSSIVRLFGVRDTIRAYKEFRNWLNALAVIDGEKINRADLCVDLSTNLPRIDVAQDVVTRARNNWITFKWRTTPTAGGIRVTGLDRVTLWLVYTIRSMKLRAAGNRGSRIYGEMAVGMAKLASTRI